MSVNMQSTKHAKWTTRLWRTLAALDEAISVSAMEHREKRIAVLEQKLWDGPQGIEARPKRLTRIGVILDATSLRGSKAATAASVPEPRHLA